MDYRLNKNAIIIGVIFALIALAVFAKIILQDKPAAEESQLAETQPQEQVTPPDRAQIITVKHDYEDGMHAVAGEIPLPTPCDRLEAEPFFVDGNRENIELQFTTTNLSEGECEEVVTPGRFKVEFEAPESAVISATLNGEGIVLNLVRIPEGEDLDSFDEFMKG